MKHLDKRSDFSSDEQFANFRSLILNDKESNIFFRSASSTRNLYGRMETVKRIMQEKSIKTTIDITRIEHRCFDDEFGFKLIEQFRKILTKEGPYIIQCDAGKKRTGFACILLEMLSGTHYSLIAQDYLKSYTNNNGLNPTKDYDIIKRLKHKRVDSIIRFIGNTNTDIANINFANAAKSYLIKYGFSEHEIRELQKRLL